MRIMIYFIPILGIQTVRKCRCLWFFALLCALFLYGCGESEDIIKKKLDVILFSDLKAVTEDLPKNSLLDSTYFTIVSYKAYKDGMYSKMAVVDFYLYKKIKVKITRKYRYYSGTGLWDRYFNANVFIEDTAHVQSR
jgi:hypothetical protein